MTPLRICERILASLPEHISIVDRGYVYRMVNDAYLCAHLRQREEIQGRSVAELLGEGLFEQAIKPRLDRCFAGETVRFEDWFDFPGPGRRYMSVAYTPYLMEDGRVEGAIVSSRDMTEHRHIQEALLAQEQRTRLLLDSMAEGMYGVDTHGLCTFVNAAALRMLGYAHMNELEGAPIHALIHHHYPDGREYPAEQCRAYQSHRHKTQVSVEDEVFWRRDGSSFPVEYWSHPLYLQDEVLGSVVTFIDITERLESRKRLFEAQEMLKMVLDTVPHFVVWKDRQSRYLGGNQAFARLAGVADPGELVGKTDHDFYWQSYAHLYQADDAQVMESGQIKHNLIEPMHTDDGDLCWLETSKAPLRDARGQVVGVLAMFHDVSERVRTEERNRQFNKVFESTAEGIMVTDPEGRILHTNPAFTAITGYSEAEAQGSLPRLLKSNRHDDSFYQGMWAALHRQGAWHGEIWNRRKDGEVFPEWLSINAVRDEEGKLTNYVAVYSDISQIKQSEAKLEFLAHHDALTGLPNRLLLQDRLEHAIERSRREERHLALLFIDLDQFKTVNDSLGHPAGDELLCHVAAQLRGSVRAEDTVARLGGDEFVVLLEQLADTDYASDVARKILRTLSRPMLLGGHTLVIGGSIGISAFPEDGESATDLLRNADAAMYRAKEEGRNTFRYYNAELTRSARERLTLEAELRLAIERQELVLHYQPQWDMSQGRITGVEALVRWRHPKEGLISPLRFIPLAEETGLILPLGEWVLFSACEQYQSWLDQGLPLNSLAVNLSPRQFRQTQLAQQVHVILEATGMPADHLELEITEGAIMEQGDNARSALNSLKSLGIKLAIDDFGTGYSSLAYLRRFPINTLKIDQSFMRDIPHDRSAMEIATTIITMAHNLHMKVLAEGVELAEQRAFLEGQGCNYAQGYLFGRPLTAEELEALVRKGSGPP